MYSSNDRPTKDPSKETINIEASCVNTNDIKKALKGKNRGKKKKGNANGLSIDLKKDAGDLLPDTLTILFTKCLQNCTIPSTWNAIIILIHKKGDIMYV